MDDGRAGTKPEDERLGRVLWQTWREVPARTRLTVTVMLTSVVVAIVFQVADGFADGAPERVVSRLVALVAGTGGALLLSIAYVLHGASQKLSSCSPRSLWRSFQPGRLGFEPRVLHRLLLALPTLGMISGVLLSMVLGLLGAGSVEGRPLSLVAAAIYGGMLLLAGRTVTRTTRFLYRHAREQAEAAAAARADATEAQLAALQARMNPHFLFNALNTVASLVRTDPKAAESTVENLAGVLRRTLDRSLHTWRTVGDEVDYLAAYLAVEQERWGRRLRIEWSIAPEIRSLPLPPMTLQPLVENALKHGLGTRLGGGTLRIAGEKENGTLRLTVADDGIGFPPRYRESTGLGTLRRRLATLYGERAELEIRSSSAGATVQLELPDEPAPRLLPEIP
ncbi:MAG TPA: histidine kinase [Thermoanaerobaculia bacterium]|jgi:signal transduction histidine kinase